MIIHGASLLLIDEAIVLIETYESDLSSEGATENQIDNLDCNRLLERLKLCKTMSPAIQIDLDSKEVKIIAWLNAKYN